MTNPFKKFVESQRRMTILTTVAVALSITAVLFALSRSGGNDANS